jgi:pilus assembly protein CpaB
MRLFLAVLAVVSGGAALWLWIGTPQLQTPGTVVTQGSTEEEAISTSVLVASRSLAAGTRLAETDFEWANRQARSVPGGSALQAVVPDAESRMAGMVVLRDLAQGDVVLWDDLATAASSRLSGHIAENRVAFAIVVSEATAVGGLVRAGDRIDVFQVQRGGATSEASMITLAKDLRVLATDQTILHAQEVPTSAPRTLTLEVDMAQLEVLARAQAEGGIIVALKPEAALPRP